ncbi:MAG: NUDIX hydrolase [Geminicoccaceae bacterium]
MPELVKLAVAAFISDAAGAVLLLRRAAHRKNAPCCWEPPIGKLEPGETVEQAVLREVAEETGLTPQLVAPFATWRSIVAREPMIGVAWLLHGDQVELTLSEEHDRARWLPPEDWAGLQLRSMVGPLQDQLIDVMQRWPRAA